MLVFLLVVIGIGWIFAYVFENILILVAAVIFSIAMIFTSYWKGDKLILSLNKAKEIKKETNKELYRLVENLCITAGLPIPKIYIIDDPSPNAFATGRDPRHSAIALTTGLLEILNKQELESVIAHELTHIKNRDTLLAAVVITLVGIISISSEIFLRSRFFYSDDDRSTNTIIFIFALLAIIVAPTVASLVQLAISRKREFLADAGSAMITRNPESLISALEKISKNKISLKKALPTMSHLYIVNPFKGKKAKKWFNKLFLTHPPIEERIAALRAVIWTKR